MNDEPSRERDEELLLWLSLRAEGLSWNRIVARVGYRGHRTGIATTTRRVQQDDIKGAAFWGDDPAEVAAHYEGQR